MFSSSICIVFLIFRDLLRLEFIPLNGVKNRSNFIFFQMALYLFQHY